MSNEVPDPQGETTFANSRLQHRLREADPHRVLRLFYQELIRFRRANYLSADPDLEIKETETQSILTVTRTVGGRRLLMIFNFGSSEVELPSIARSVHWTTELHSADSRWLGPSERFPRSVGPTDAVTLPGQSFVVFSYEGKGHGYPL